MPPIENLIQTFGYWVVLAGTFFEGETIMVLGGFTAHRGYLNLGWVILTGFIGSFSGDQFFFFLGRYRRESILKYPSWKERFSKAHDFLERHNLPVLLGFRFIYGMRMIIPFTLGTSSFSYYKFLFLNMIGALIWSVAVGLAGYAFGQAIEAFFAEMKRYEFIIMACIIAAGIFVWLISRLLKETKA
jgi:membrane protein DedA with SNARE-associated domain